MDIFNKISFLFCLHEISINFRKQAFYDKKYLMLNNRLIVHLAIEEVQEVTIAHNIKVKTLFNELLQNRQHF